MELIKLELPYFSLQLFFQLRTIDSILSCTFPLYLALASCFIYSSSRTAWFLIVNVPCMLKLEVLLYLRHSYPEGYWCQIVQHKASINFHVPSVNAQQHKQHLFKKILNGTSFILSTHFMLIYTPTCETNFSKTYSCLLKLYTSEIFSP